MLPINMPLGGSDVSRHGEKGWQPVSLTEAQKRPVSALG